MARSVGNAGRRLPIPARRRFSGQCGPLQAPFPGEITTPTADPTGVMRPVEGGYLSNLQVPGDAKPGDLYTIRVRPFGDGNPDAGIAVVLLLK